MTETIDEEAGEPSQSAPIAPDDLATALDVIGLGFERAELELMGSRVARHRDSYARFREAAVAWDEPPAIAFEPRLPGVTARTPRTTPQPPSLPAVERPIDDAELAWLTIPELATLVRSRQVSCRELAAFALDRLRAVDPALRAVVTLTEDRAMDQAASLDEDLDAGRWRGPLHGIPWGAKDLLAVAGYPTTWGTPPFADQRIGEDATVVGRLDDAGAVLVAKLSLGELAWGDVWTGGRTNNPWDLSEGASGSSAGSAAAVAAGAVPFAIGSETLGSIMFPARQCGITGLRPTYGRVPRTGAMPLAWTLDKVGPMARSGLDCALVLEAVAGWDGVDGSPAVGPFRAAAPADPRGWRIGVVERAFEAQPEADGILDELGELGCELVPFLLPEFPLDDALVIVAAEAAASFDDLTRSGDVRRMVRDEDEAWPNMFRAARLVPAVEYLRAMRLRRRVQLEMSTRMADVDLIVQPSVDASALSVENLTGHPAITLPWGRRENGAPGSVAFAGQLDGETDLLAFAAGWQQRTGHHRRRPPI